MEPDPVPGHPTPGMNVWGWMSPEELEWLHARAAEMGSVAEIGVLHGRSATALLSGCPGPVWCIDPWDDVGDRCLPSFMRSCGHFRNLRVVRGYSPAAALEVDDVDMTFIDGAHDYDSVVADLTAWLPKTRRLICGHDYEQEPVGANYPDVKRAVDERFGERVVLTEGISIWAVWL